MSPEQFEQILRHSRPEEFVATVNPLDETSRKACLKIVKAVRKDVNKMSNVFPAGETAKEWERRRKAREKWQSRNPHVEANVAIGLLACGAASDAHRVRIWEIRGKSEDLVTSVLIARNPGWITTWVNKRLGGEFPELNWKMVRDLIGAGLIDKPDSDGYITLFVEAMRGYQHNQLESYIPTSERLVAEPEFLEHEVWRIFDFENHALTTDWDARHQSGPENYETWPEAIIRLANDKHLDRDRLLDITLSSMQREMKQNQLSAYGKLHSALAPNADEMKIRQQAYVDLLVSPIGPVLSFAVKMLAKLHRAKLLDSELFFDSVRPVFAHKTKGTAMQVLKITEKLDNDDRTLNQKIMAVAIAAMSHASPDVQTLALGILERDFGVADDATRQEFERQIAFLAAKLQPRAMALLGEEKSDGGGPADESDPGIDLRAVEALAPKLRKLAGIEAPLVESMPAVLDYRIRDLPCPVSRERLELVDTQERLLELAARLIETVEAPAEVEVLIDGIARHGQNRGGNFKKLSAPLIQRIETGQTSRDGLGSVWGATATALIDLLLTWWTGNPYDSRKSQYYSESAQESFAATRIREVQVMLLAGDTGPLLATPSYRRGWVDPEDLVARLCEISASKRNVYDGDLMQALLRLGPGDRGKALDTAADIPGDVARMVRFALGGEDMPKRSDRNKAHVWFCAARAREPHGSLEMLLGPIASKIPKLPGMLASMDWNWSVKVEENQGYRRASIVIPDEYSATIDVSGIYRHDLLKEAKKKLTEPVWKKWPTASIRTWPEQTWYALYQYGAPWRIEWLAMQHPADTESYMSIAVRLLDFRSDEDTSRDTPVHAFLAALFDPTRPWGNMSVLALSIGLLSRSADSRGYAIDALIPAIESGHADVSDVAATLARLIDNGAYKINRLGISMAAIRDVSVLHAWWVGRLVDGIVEQLETPPKGAHFLYDIALDCMLPLQARPSGAMAARLKAHKGSSKTAKLAKELLALDGTSIREPNSAVISAAWEGRLRLAGSFVH